MPETVIRPALTAQELAVDLIAEHHEHLEEARILWLFTTAKSTRGGRAVLGKSKRLGAEARFLSSGNVSIREGYDFVLVIAEQSWTSMGASQRLALVDSLLCRCAIREVENKTTGRVTKTWYTVSPDVEEFSEVIRRHGLWLPELKTMARAIGSKQLRMLEQDDARQASRKAPAERVTTVEADGVVASTELVQQQDAIRLVKCERCDGVGAIDFEGKMSVCPDCLGDGQRIAAAAGADSAQSANGSVTDSEAPTALERSPGSSPHTEGVSSNGSVTDPDQSAPTWQQTTGIGASAPEQRRRARTHRARATANA